MAKMTLPTNFQDDIPNESMNGRRRYNVINNPDGTISLEDVTEYDQVGSTFGGGQINQTNTAVNESADKNKIIDDFETIQAVTEIGYIAGALALKEVNANLELRISDLNTALQEVISGFATSLSGTLSIGSIRAGESVDRTITFSETFGKIPSVIATASGTYNNSQYGLTVTVKNISQGGFSVNIKNPLNSAVLESVKLTWNATA